MYAELYYSSLHALQAYMYDGRAYYEYIVVIQKDQVLRGTGNCQKVVKYNNLVPN